MAAQRITVELPPDLDAPAFARATVADHGADLDPRLVADAVLCVSEVVTNAVEHGRPAITLRLDTGRGGLGVEVTDHGGPLDVATLGPVDDADPHGRGLRILDALSQNWGVRSGESADHGANKTVWFDLHPEADDAPPPAAVELEVFGDTATVRVSANSMSRPRRSWARRSTGSRPTRRRSSWSSCRA